MHQFINVADIGVKPLALGLFTNRDSHQTSLVQGLATYNCERLFKLQVALADSTTLSLWHTLKTLV